jgi:hypothetical protein
MEWWYKFGLNPVGIHPQVSEVGRMFFSIIEDLKLLLIYSQKKNIK